MRGRGDEGCLEGSSVELRADKAESELTNILQKKLFGRCRKAQLRVRNICELGPSSLLNTQALEDSTTSATCEEELAACDEEPCSPPSFSRFSVGKQGLSLLPRN